METQTMGRVLVTARIENVEDLYDVKRGRLAPDQVRFVEVNDAIVDMGATILAMPTQLIAQLGLTRQRSHRVRSHGGNAKGQVYGTARITIKGRDCPTDVLELPDDALVRIDRITCLAMDWVIDPKTDTLTGNPAHGGEQIYEAYGTDYGLLQYDDDDPWHGYINTVMGLYCCECGAFTQGRIRWVNLSNTNYPAWCSVVASEARAEGWTHTTGDDYFCPICSPSFGASPRA